MLQGNVPGLLSVSSSGQPGAASEMRIRGTGSILASSEPLYAYKGSDDARMEPVPRMRISEAAPGCPEELTDNKPGTLPCNILSMLAEGTEVISSDLTEVTDPLKRSLR